MNDPDYTGLTRKEILALPLGERKAAFRANPGETKVHVDCRCNKCGYRYSFGSLKKYSRDLTNCPKCAEGNP